MDQLMLADRKAILNHVFGAMKWQGLLDFLAKSSSWEQRLRVFFHPNFNPWAYSKVE
jgi:hypothetical protein